MYTDGFIVLTLCPQTAGYFEGIVTVKNKQKNKTNKNNNKKNLFIVALIVNSPFNTPRSILSPYQIRIA